MYLATQHLFTNGFLARRRPAPRTRTAPEPGLHQYGGSRVVASGPLLRATGAATRMVLTHVSLSVVSGVLIEATANRRTAVATGGRAELVAQDQKLVGSVLVDDVSSASVTLRDGSSLRGEVDPTNAGGAASLALDGSSSWTVTGTSHVARVTGLDLRGSTVRNIRGNGYSVYYDAATVPTLGGRTYRLAGGGQLSAQ